MKAWIVITFGNWLTAMPFWFQWKNLNLILLLNCKNKKRSFPIDQYNLRLINWLLFNTYSQQLQRHLNNLTSAMVLASLSGIALVGLLHHWLVGHQSETCPHRIYSLLHRVVAVKQKDTIILLHLLLGLI